MSSVEKNHIASGLSLLLSDMLLYDENYVVNQLEQISEARNKTDQMIKQIDREFYKASRYTKNEIALIKAMDEELNGSSFEFVNGIGIIRTKDTLDSITRSSVKVTSKDFESKRNK